LANGERCPETTLDLSPIRLGNARSWTANALKLLQELGPFKLAYLEAVLRAADVRASQKEAGHA
jgi:CRISPR-associated endonuclease/helicase Cas3